MRRFLVFVLFTLLMWTAVVSGQEESVQDVIDGRGVQEVVGEAEVQASQPQPEAEVTATADTGIVPRLGLCDEVDPRSPMVSADLKVFKGCELTLLATYLGDNYLWMVNGVLQHTAGSALSLQLPDLGVYSVKVIIQDVVNQAPQDVAEAEFTIAVADGFKTLPGTGCDDAFYICWFQWVVTHPIEAVSYLLNLKSAACEFGVLQC